MMLRIIDANFNRVREALRVIEDIVRFHNANKKFASIIRKFRHSFTLSYIRYFGRYASIFRNIETDPGKTNPPCPAEGIKEIVQRNFFRIEEGLRCIEECSRISNPVSTESWQKLRFSIYEIEQKIMSEIPDRSIPCPFTGLYFSGISPEDIKMFLNEFTDEELSIIIIEPRGQDNEFIKNLVKLKSQSGKKLILITKRFDIVLAADIDGVHLEHGSLKSYTVRKFIPGKIIGMTLKKRQKLKKQDSDSVNYVAYDWASEKHWLLTENKKNIKVYIAAIICPRQKIVKTMLDALDGVIVRYNTIDKVETLRIRNLFREFKDGKKTRSAKG